METKGQAGDSSEGVPTQDRDRDRDYLPKAYSSIDLIVFAAKLSAIVVVLIGLLWALDRSL